MRSALLGLRVPEWRALFAGLCLCVATFCAAAPAQAGVLTRAELVRRFPAPLIVGERDAELPVWPLFKQNATAIELVGYVFESIDLAPIPGFSGVPLNLMVAIDPKGVFIGVQVLSQHEPVFLDGLGEAPLLQFVQQYKDLSLKQNISIAQGTRSGARSDAANAHIDGISKATASVRIINQSVLAAALKVSRKKLGFGAARDPDQIAQVRGDVFEQRTWQQLCDEGLVQHLRVSNRAVEKLFAGSAGAGLDGEAASRPDEPFIDLYLAYVSVPSIGRNLLNEAGWRKLQGRLEPGDHALLVMSSGRYSITGEDFVPGSVPDRLLLRQEKLPIDMRDLDLDMRFAQGVPAFENVTVLRVIAQAGLDPAAAMEFALPITRNKGIVYPERITRELGLSYQLPSRLLIPAQASSKSWQGIWQARQSELALLVAGLLVLAGALLMQRRLTSNAHWFVWVRRVYLCYTVGFIGYYAQGQLSIVNLTGAIQALMAGRSLEFLLFDPMTVLLWGFVALSLVLWGRGTFCGWLCPFGALQEFSHQLARKLRVPQKRLRTRLDRRLKRIKYVLLALILGSAFCAAEWTDRLVELEPFKTAITLNFVRSLPYVLYAVVLLMLSGVIYKFYCRYLCPFGGALALLGKLRWLSWIPRRSECGTPCQTCRHRCDYQAISPAGQVEYDECFQCMDCVVIYQSEQRCAPRMLELKRATVIPIQPVMKGGESI
ncbi:4Fe-4S binding protein [Pseudoduganella danionis]|uniref:4Fe-4S binding protein n=1 Tax=Pseudoduganella danionis TaxID=1890295 RepID=A0ABW9SUJ7_9BURK|nr:4Fe-4S binding protein [Pseudoduganella danionis]MTW35535.1 4Fe-4S binding protein [Pseudoduganella danionis]